MARNNSLFALALLMVASCSMDGANIDNIIEKYDNADFSPIVDKSIHFRSRGVESNTSIYVVSKYPDAEGYLYWVTVDNRDKSIVKVEESDVDERSNGKSFTREEVIKSIECYLQYPFFLIQVDKNGNVYISPVEQDRPSILRKTELSTIADIEQYKQYRNNWYIRK